MHLAPIKHSIWQRRQEIAAQWQKSLAEFENHNYPFTLDQFTELIERYIAAIFTEPLDKGTAYAVGEQIVLPYHLHPAILTRSHSILTGELTKGLPAEELQIIHPVVIKAFNHFLTGYAEFSYSRVIISQDEKIEKLADVQEQANLISSKQDGAWQALIHLIAAPVVFHDGHRILYANPITHTTLGYAPQDLTGQPITSLFAPWAQKSLTQVVKTSIIIPYETAVSTQDDTIKTIQFYNVPLRYQQEDIFGLLFQEITPEESQPTPPPDFELTNREKQVLQQVAADNDDEATAENLGITTRTVRFHLQNALKKLDVSSRAAAIHKLWQYGLMEEIESDK